LGLKAKIHSSEELVAKTYSGVENLLMLLIDWWNYTKIIYMPGGKLAEINKTMQDNLYRIKKGKKKPPDREDTNYEEQEKIKEFNEKVKEELKTSAKERPKPVKSKEDDLNITYDPSLLIKKKKVATEFDSDEERAVKAYDNAAFLHSYIKEGIEHNKEEKEIFETLTQEQLSKVIDNNSFKDRKREEKFRGRDGFIRRGYVWRY